MQNKVDKYFIEKNISKLTKRGYTNFLDGKELNTIKHILNKEHLDYQIYEPFVDADYKCLYNSKPDITCFKIITNEKLKHNDIMGALYNFNIDNDAIGDIIINNNYYFLIISDLREYIINNFNQIGRYNIRLEEVDIPILERKYQDLEYIVTSIRIDTVLSRITNINRNEIQDLILKKEVILNYDILTNKSYILKENDTFSIRKYGKYKYAGIIKNTKKDNYVIKIEKYV